MTGIARRVVGAGLLAVTLSAAWVEGAGAQEWLLGPGAAFFGVGVSEIATGGLDARLAASGYPTFGSTASAVSLGAYRILPKGVILGGEWHGIIMGEEAQEGREVGLGGGYGTLGVGYLVDLSRRVRMYPRVGLGGGGMGVWIESESPSVPFDEVLDDPRPEPNRVTVLSRGSMVVDLGAGAEFLPIGRGRGPLIGLRIGYIAAPFSGGWRLEGEWTDGAPVTGGPHATLAGPYLRVTLGGAWRR